MKIYPSTRQAPLRRDMTDPRSSSSAAPPRGTARPSLNDARSTR